MRKILSFILASALSHLSLAQISPVWTNRYNGIGDFSDKWNSIALDASGNIYLTGSTMVSGNYTDIITTKLNSLGDTLWVRTYNGVNNKNDKGNDIKVDASGNVYVAGTVDNAAVGNDIITIKYNSSGTAVWTSIYDGSGLDDNAVALAIDGAGNVYVTGYSDTDPTAAISNDYVTIQYNSSGAQQWATTYDGAGAGNDQTVGIGLDNSANVYVTGRSDSDPAATINDDYVTIQYDITGAQIWLQVYDGGFNDHPAAIKTDASGNSYITGNKSTTASASSNDYYTIVYDNAGATLWSASYNGVGLGNDKAAAIAYDASGNVYVTGQSDADATTVVNYDYVTVKYNSAGTQQWAADYNGTGNNNDIPSDIGLNATGTTVYVTGKSDLDPSTVTNYDYATVQYDVNGSQQWAQRYNGSANLSDGANAMALDGSGNCFVTGGSVETITQKDGTTIKYNSAGAQQWIKHYNGSGDNSDNGSAVTTDASGNAYVAGYTFGNGTDRDLCVMKINATLGDTAWVRKYSGTGNGVDQATAIALDASGNVYVAGYEKDLSAAYDYITIKYNSSGVQQWASPYNGLGNGNDKATAMVIDNAGNVFVTGYSDIDATAAVNEDYVTIMYNSSGIQQWATSYNGSGNASDRATGAVLDASNNVYVTGKSFNGVNYDYVTLKYNSTGVQQNVATYSGGNGDDIPNVIVIDASANVYVTGQSASINLFNDCVTIKYNSSLSQQWASTYNGSTSVNRNDQANAITVDGAGNVYIAGQTATDTSVTLKNYDYLTIKYNSAGTQQWVKTYNGQANLNDVAAGIAVDGAGNIYVTGQCSNGTSLLPNKDYGTIIYDNAGTQIATAIYNGTGNGTDGANAIAVTGSVVYVTGSSWGGASQKDIVTLKYNALTTGISNAKILTDLVSVYPNPSSGKFTVQISSEHPSGPSQVSIYNMLGSKIHSEAISQKQLMKNGGEVLFSIDLSDMPNDIYFIHVETNSGTITQKVVIQK